MTINFHLAKSFVCAGCFCLADRRVKRFNFCMCTDLKLCTGTFINAQINRPFPKWISSSNARSNIVVFISISKHSPGIKIMSLNGKCQINGYRSHIAQIFRTIVLASDLTTNVISSPFSWLKIREMNQNRKLLCVHMKGEHDDDDDEPSVKIEIKIDNDSASATHPEAISVAFSPDETARFQMPFHANYFSAQSHTNRAIVFAISLLCCGNVYAYADGKFPAAGNNLLKGRNKKLLLKHETKML